MQRVFNILPTLLFQTWLLICPLLSIRIAKAPPRPSLLLLWTLMGALSISVLTTPTLPSIMSIQMQVADSCHAGSREIHLMVYLWRRWNHSLKEISAHSCSLQHYQQQQRHGNNLNVRQQMNEWRKWDVYIYTRAHTPDYYSTTKKEENLAFCDNMSKGYESIVRKISQTDKEKYCMISLICGP